MKRNRWIHFGASIAAASLPILLWAYSSGPDPKKSGAPGDDPASCTGSGCHNGQINKDSGNIEILWEGGGNYQPGVKQRFTVKIKDVGRQYGMQASIRIDSGPINTNQAGTFTPLDSKMFVLCQDGRERDFIPGKVCSPNAPVEYIEHSIPSSTGTFQFDWTPPNQAGAGVGPITLYVATNASNGPAPAGANISQKTFKLNQAVGGGGFKPTISQGGAVSAGSFGGGTKVAASSYLEIFGKDLATTTRSWAGGDFSGAKAPTNLDNTQVTVDGKAAYVNYISPTQVNVVVPDGIASGPVQVVVKTAGGSSDPVAITGASVAPGILAPGSFLVNGKQYVVAQFADGTFAGRVGLIAGVTFRTPKPGDTLVIYGLGFGTTTPAVPAGTIVGVSTDLGSSFKVQIGAAPAAAAFKGLAPNFVGLYQFNVVVPNVQAGDQEITMEIGGVKTQANVFLTTAN